MAKDLFVAGQPPSLKPASTPCSPSAQGLQAQDPLGGFVAGSRGMGRMLEVSPDCPSGPGVGVPPSSIKPCRRETVPCVGDEGVVKPSPHHPSSPDGAPPRIQNLGLVFRMDTLTTTARPWAGALQSSSHLRGDVPGPEAQGLRTAQLPSAAPSRLPGAPGEWAEAGELLTQQILLLFPSRPSL